MGKKMEKKYETCKHCGAEFHVSESPEVWAAGEICAGAFEDDWLMCLCPKCNERHRIHFRSEVKNETELMNKLFHSAWDEGKIDVLPWFCFRRYR